MDRKKVVYISGPISGVAEYWKAFEQAEDDINSLGYIPLSPSRLPGGMTNEQYMKICTAMIDSADMVLLLPNWRDSQGAKLEAQYCEYTGKPFAEYEMGENTPHSVTIAWLRHDLEEVFKI